ncbi:phage tail tape measure protein TP901 family [Eubacterium sp. CAG:786]|nr:phage tail tape measure protein TP901 family [Eubacterium sp. CAG:786]
MTGLSGAGAVTAVIGGVAAAVVALTAVFAINIKQFQQYRKEITDEKLFDNGGKSLKNYTELLKESTSEHYKYAQEVNSASEELDGIDYELSKATDSLTFYNQILDENGTLTADQADAMYEPFNEFAGKLEEDFQARYDLVFDAFKTSAVEAAQQLGISIGEIETVLDGFKNRFTTSASDSQKTITALLDKQRNGEELTAEDWDTYRKEIQFQTDMANAAPDSAKSEYEAMKEEVSDWDFGTDQQSGIDNLNELYQYASDYISEMDKAQTNLNAEYDALREQAKIMHDSGKSTDEEYSADVTALNQAQQITYAAYKERRDNFIDEFNTTWSTFTDQIDKEVVKGMEEAGFNFFESFWNNFKGTMATYGEQYGNLFTGKGTTYSDQQLISGSVSSAKADEYKLAASKNTYSGLYDAAGQYSPGDFGAGAKDPGYSSDLDSLKISKIPGHANGSSFTEDAFIAGENGPELIVGAPGRRVFTADETSMLLGVMPQALSLAAYSRARSMPVNITVNSSFNGSSADYSAYNDDLAEKIYRIFAEKADDERRNAYY